VIASGEKWDDGSLRPAIEDFAGAGAIIRHLSGSKSPEAQLAEDTFSSCRDISMAIKSCSSGRELQERDFGADVQLAVELDASQTVPFLSSGEYVNKATNDAVHQVP